MNKLLLSAALTAALASPAFAQSFDPDVGSGNLVENALPNPGSTFYGYGTFMGPAGLGTYGAYGYGRGYGAFAAEPRPLRPRARARIRTMSETAPPVITTRAQPAARGLSED